MFPLNLKPFIALLVVASCVPSTPGSSNRLAGSSSTVPPTGAIAPPLTSPPTCVDVGAEVPLWTAAPGWQFINVRTLRDINGDGYQDALVFMGAESGEQVSVVHGPLRRALTLPDDQAWVVPGRDLTALEGDITGDGQPDFIWHEAFLVRHVIEGPFLTAPPGTGSSLGLVPNNGEIADIDRDGVLDLFYWNVAPNELYGWMGHWSTWTEAPTFTLHFDCPSDSNDPGTPWLTSVPDTDGDNLPELYAYGATDLYLNCGAWMLPTTVAGTVNVETAGVGYQVRMQPWPVGDQDGDGDIDFKRAESTAFVSAPLTWVDGRVDGPTVLTINPSIEHYYPLGVDLNNDEIGDFAELSADEQVRSIYTGGPAGGLATGTPLACFSHGSGIEVFVEDDAALFPQIVDNGVAFLTLAEHAAFVPLE